MSLLTTHRSFLPALPSLFQNMFEDDDDFGRFFASRDVIPAVNVLEHESDYEIDFAVPGLHKKDFQVFIDNGQLVVSAEHKVEDREEGEQFMRKEFNYSSFRRVFSLPEDVKEDDIKARYEDGILKVRLGKIDIKPKAQPRKVAIQ